MLPNIANSLLQVYEAKGVLSEDDITKLLGKDIKWDFEVNKTVIDKGYPIDLIEKKEITKQWIQKVFETGKNRYMTYIVNESEPAFGFPLREYIGKLEIPSTLVLAEMEKEIIEMMLVFPYIAEVIDVFMIKNKDKLFIFYTVVTVDNELLVNEAF